MSDKLIINEMLLKMKELFCQYATLCEKHSCDKTKNIINTYMDKVKEYQAQVHEYMRNNGMYPIRRLEAIISQGK